MLFFHFTVYYNFSSIKTLNTKFTLTVLILKEVTMNELEIVWVKDANGNLVQKWVEKKK